MTNSLRIRDVSNSRADRLTLEMISGTDTWSAVTLPKQTELTMLSGITAGSVTASKTLVADANKTIRFGDWVAAAATSGGVAFTAALDTYADGQVDILQVHGASAADLTSAKSAKCGRFRHVVNGITANHETYGLVGQVVGKNVTYGHLHAGLMGTFEVNTASTINSAYVYGVAGTISRVGVGTNALTCTTALCGFSSIYNGAALATGSAYAYGATSTTTTTWGSLLAADKCDNLLYTATGTAYESGVKIASITIDDADGAAGVIRCNIGGTAYYIPLYVAADLDGE